MAQAPSAHPTLKDRDSFQSIPSQTNLGLRTTLDDVSDVNKMHNKLLSWSFSRKSYDSDRESYVDSLNSLSSSLKERLNLVGAHAHSGIIMPSPSHSARGGDAQSPKSFVSLSDEQLVHTPSAGGSNNNNGNNNNNQPNLGNFKFKKQKSKDSDHKTPKHTKGLPSVTFSSTVSLFSESDKRKNSILFHEVHGVKANITSDTEDSKEREVRKTKNKNKNKNKNNNDSKKTNNKTNNNKGKGTGKGTKGKGKGKGGKGKATLKSSTMDNNNNDSKKTGQDPKKRLKKVGTKTKNNKNKNNNNKKNKDDEKTAPNNNNNKGTGKKGKKRKKNAIAQGYLAKLRNQG